MQYYLLLLTQLLLSLESINIYYFSHKTPSNERNNHIWSLSLIKVLLLVG